MSLDLLLMSMPDETFDRSIVEQAFATLVNEVDCDDWPLLEPDGVHRGAYISIATSSRISGFSVERPPFIHEFWEAVFEVLRNTRTFLVWPSPQSPSYCVANPDWESYLGDDPLEMGRPAFVASAAEIPDVIEASFWLHSSLNRPAPASVPGVQEHPGEPWPRGRAATRNIVSLDRRDWRRRVGEPATPLPAKSQPEARQPAFRRPRSRPTTSRASLM